MDPMMEPLMDWNQLLIKPLMEMGQNTIAYIPNLIAGLFILAVGLLLALLARILLEGFLSAVDFDRLARKIQLFPEGDGPEAPRLPPRRYVGAVTYWAVILTAVAAALSRLRLGGVAFQIEAIVHFAVSVVSVAVIAAAGLFLSMLVYRIVSATASGAGFSRPALLGQVAQWAVVFSTALVCLFRIGIPKEFITVVLGATYVTLCITFILAFGIGGTGFAAAVLNRWVGPEK